MDLKTEEIPRFYFATVVPVELTAETAFPAGVYTFAVKSRRSVTDPLIALATVTLEEPATTLSADLDFDTESGLAQAQAGDLEAWLEISTSGVVVYQREVLYLPRVYDGSTPAPTPVTAYYTAAEVDALIAGISGAVDSVNGKTGEVVLDADDVGAVATPVREALISTTFAPAPLSIYTHTVAEGDALDFGTPTGGVPVVFKLDLTIPEGEPSFSFAQAITWEGGSAPDFSAAGVYPLYFEYDGGWRGWRRPDMSEYMPWSGVAPLAQPVSIGRTKANGQATTLGTLTPINAGNENYYADLGAGAFLVRIFPPLIAQGYLRVSEHFNAAGFSVGALTGLAITVPPTFGQVTVATAVDGMTITLQKPAVNIVSTHELHLTMPSPSVSVSFADEILWEDASGEFKSTNSAPDLTEGGVVYLFVFRRQNGVWLGFKPKKLYL